MRNYQFLVVLILAACLLWQLGPEHITLAQALTLASGSWGSIQEAINAAGSGDTVFVPAGSYFENLTINKSLCLLGEGWSNTILNGSGNGSLVTILSDNVSISGFTFCNAEKAVEILNVSNCEVRANYITHIILYYGVGIHVINCNNVTIIENRFNDIFYDSVFLVRTNCSRITDNLFDADSRYNQAVLLYQSHQNVIDWNEVSGEKNENEGGIGLIYSDGNQICYNNIILNDWSGIGLQSSNRTIIEGNTIFGHTWYGVTMGKCRDNSFYWNNFIGNFKDVDIQSCANTTWNSSDYGNYWDKYGGRDENNDGIGDKIGRASCRERV